MTDDLIAEKADTLETFLRALREGHRVVVQTPNALGSDDAHYFPAAELAADLEIRETLIAELLEHSGRAFVRAEKAEDCADAAEAKLARARESLSNIAVMGTSDDPSVMANIARRAVQIAAAAKKEAEQ